ncbi:MAG: hypothetical protein QOD95_2833, partial [Gammaproteobacteria bacterium]|nr:hypothetical protein [Gammaproteobacteria bacterium]
MTLTRQRFPGILAAAAWLLAAAAGHAETLAPKTYPDVIRQ